MAEWSPTDWFIRSDPLKFKVHYSGAPCNVAKEYSSYSSAVKFCASSTQLLFKEWLAYKNVVAIQHGSIILEADKHTLDN